MTLMFFSARYCHLMVIKIFFLLLGAMFSSSLMAATSEAPDNDLVWVNDSQVDRQSNDFIGLSLGGTRNAYPGSDILQGARFTLKHEFSAQIKEPHELANNRSVFRVEYEKYFLENFYVHLDVMETGYWSNDHVAKAQGKDFFSETTFRDTYLQFSKGKTSVKVGRKILIWGESDAGAITDVIAPRDLSELFFISLESSRLSQFMATVDHFTQVGDWSFFYIPHPSFNKYPRQGTAYYVDPFNGTANTTTVNDYSHPEYGMRWKKTFGSSDVSLMAARLTDNDYAIHQIGFLSDGKLLIMNDAQRFSMFGATFNHATNGFIFTGEIAKKSPRAFLNSNTLETVKKDGIDTSLRVEYSLGNGGNHTASLEAVNRHVVNWGDDILPVERNTNSLVLGWSNSFLNDNLSANWLSVYNQTNFSLQHSLFLTYKLDNHLSLEFNAFYLSVRDPNNSLYPYNGENKAIVRAIYQF